MALGVNGSGVNIIAENPNKALDGGIITHTATAAALATYTPAAGGPYDSVLVTNVSANTWVRITVIGSAGLLGNKVFVLAPSQAKTVGFDGLDQITAVSSVPVTMPIANGAVAASAPAILAAPGELVQVTVEFAEK